MTSLQQPADDDRADDDHGDGSRVPARSSTKNGVNARPEVRSFHCRVRGGTGRTLDHRARSVTSDASARPACRPRHPASQRYCASRSCASRARSTPARFSTTRRRSAGAAPGSRRARHRRVAQFEVRERRRVEAHDDVLRDLVAARVPDRQQHGEVRSTNSPSRATVAGCWNPSAVYRTIAFGRSSLSTTDAHAARFASRVGIAARAEPRLAALGGVVGGQRRVDRLRVGDAARGERGEQLPGQVGVDLEALEGRLAVAQLLHASPVRGASRPRSRRTSRTGTGVAAGLGAPARAPTGRRRPGDRRRRASRARRTRSPRAASWASVVRIVVDSVSAAMLPSTSST